MSGPVTARFDPCGTPPVSLTRRHPLEAEVRHLRATVRVLTTVAGCRETERAEMRKVALRHDALVARCRCGAAQETAELDEGSTG